jgi:hypothetical protein
VLGAIAIGLLMLSVLAVLGCAVPVLRDVRLERTLSLAARSIVGVPVRVNCQSTGASMVDPSGDLGHVRFGPDGVPEREALLKRPQCRAIARWRDGGREDPDSEQVIALHVLTHEAMHMRGLVTESAAECAAVQRDAAMARALGGSPSEAALLARRYWLEVYPMLVECLPQCGMRSR